MLIPQQGVVLQNVMMGCYRSSLAIRHPSLRDKAFILMNHRFHFCATFLHHTSPSQQSSSTSSSAGTGATVLQSAFNLANILMGVGLLGLPFGFAVAGWAGGLLCTTAFGVITWRTSLLIGRELNGDPRPSHYFDDNPYKSPHAPGSAHGRLLPPIAGFPDIARRAFGRTGCYGGIGISSLVNCVLTRVITDNL